MRTDDLRKLVIHPQICKALVSEGRSQWWRGLRREYAAACQLGLWVRIPPGTWMSTSCE